MSTGNNKDDTLVSKKRKRILAGYIHPNKPEIKKFDFFSGGEAYSGSYRMHNSKEFITTCGPTQPEPDQVGSWQLVRMVNPSNGVYSDDVVGKKYFLKYIKFKGHIGISVNLPFTIRYKLLLIKSDKNYTTIDQFMADNMCNYEPIPAFADALEAVEHYARHNFYKTYKYAPGMAANHTSVTVVSSGTLTPTDYMPRPTRSSTLGEHPSWTYTLPDVLRFTTIGDQVNEISQLCYLPLNVSVQVNDNVEISKTWFYLMLVTDHGVGVRWPNYDELSQFLYRASKLASATCARFNFFGTCYFTDL